MDLAEILGIDLENPADASAVDMEETRQRLLDQLVEIRKSRGMTISSVAKELGISRQAASKIERGSRDPRLSTLIRYAMAVSAHISMDAKREELWFEKTRKSRSTQRDEPSRDSESKSSKVLDEATSQWAAEIDMESFLLPSLRNAGAQSSGSHRTSTSSTFTMTSSLASDTRDFCHA